MTRDSEQKLLVFCMEQQQKFEPSAWLVFPHPDQDELLAAILFLAGVDWYGYKRELIEVAKQIEPEAIGNLAKVAQRCCFDLSRFSYSLRKQINHESIVRAS